MLIEFSVGNYRSFHAPVTLSMQAAKLRSRDKQLDENSMVHVGGLSLLRSAAIYGANASGKSNLIRAMGWMRRFVLQSSKESQVGEPTGVDPFRLSTTTPEAPSYFQIVFYLDGMRYRYGFEIDSEVVRSEWLYHANKRETRLFIREGDAYDLSSVFKEGHGLEARTRPNALFLSVVAQFNGNLAIALLDWFRRGFNIISGLEDVTYRGFTLRRFEEDEAFRQRVVAFVREADLGIANISIERQPFGEAGVPENLRHVVAEVVKEVIERDAGRYARDDVWVNQIQTTHKVYDQQQTMVGLETFDMQEQESQGTQKIFNLSGPLMDTLEKGKVLVIDEMEARLHPFITRAIIQLFNASQTNPHNAQLIFATHDTGLLSHRFFRRDQIWFTEKDRYGATDLYALSELQVRNDASFDKDYVRGKYGAIPFIGGLYDLFGAQRDGENA
jgi:hypothetical protein